MAILVRVHKNGMLVGMRAEKARLMRFRWE
jgi:hypothetical protein